MAVKYVGNAATFNFEGTLYARPDVYAKNPSFYDHSYDTPIKGLSVERAEKMAASSNIHKFEDANTGADILEEATAPNIDNAHLDVEPEDLPQVDPKDDAFLVTDNSKIPAKK